MNNGEILNTKVNPQLPTNQKYTNVRCNHIRADAIQKYDTCKASASNVEWKDIDQSKRYMYDLERSSENDKSRGYGRSG